MARSSTNVDAGLAVAAQRLVERSLGIVAGERVVVVYDAAHATMAEIVCEVVRYAKSEPLAFSLESLGPRPHAHVAARVADAIATAQASVLLVDFLAGELEMRAEMVDHAARRGLRHAHMVGVSRASLIGGLSADPDRIAEKARAIAVRLRPDSRIAVRSAAGTDLAITLAPTCRWTELGTVVVPGKAVNLPGGELMACPQSVDGVCVANGTIGDAEGSLARRLGETPLVLRIASSRVQTVTCERDPGFARAVSRRLMTIANLDRVALVVFGVNVGLKELMGDVATDQKVPGLHVSLGDTFPDRTGATWTAKSWVGLAFTEQDVDVDKTPVLRGGRYVI